jgi:opacity protein-like surface antigen
MTATHAHQGLARVRVSVLFATVVVLVMAASLVVSASALAAVPPLTRAPENVTGTSALFNGFTGEGTLEGGTYTFRYKATKVATLAECESAGASITTGGTYPAVEFERIAEEATGLLPDTEYVVCLAVKDTGGEAVGNPVAFVTPPPAPETVEASEVTATSAKLGGVLKPPGAKLTYEFEYAAGASCTGELTTKAAEGEDAVATVVEGLAPVTKYTFCIVARNAGGVATGEPKSFETSPAAPGVPSESVTQVTGDSAHLQAELQSFGLPTTYHFEYDTRAYTEGEPAHGTSTPVPDGSVGPSFAGPLPALLAVGLTPSTTYHYRLVAHNSLGTTDGPDMTFVTQGAEFTGLLDGRMWELVSPAEKHGTALEAITEEGGLIQAAEDGSGLAYVAKGPVQENVEGNRSIADSQLLAKRENGVWSTRDITTPHENPSGIEVGFLSEYKIFSNDLSAGFVFPAGSTRLAPQATEPTPYRRETASGAYVPLVYPGNVPAATKWGGEEFGPERFINGIEFVTATPDGRHAILASHVPLTTGVVENGTRSLYEWTAGAFTLVSEIPTAPATTCGGSGPACVSAAEEGGAVLGHSSQQVRNAISDNGNRVTISAQGSFSEGEAGLFVRDLARGETVHVDVPQEGAPGESGHAVFQLASSDGRRVFFTDQARLTTDATANGGLGEKNLYMCTIEVVGGHLSCALKDLTVPPSGEAADVQFAVIGSATTGELVYFVANGALVPGAAHGDCTSNEHTNEAPAANSCNLYVYDAATEQVHLVAVLSNRDSNDWGSSSNAVDPGTLTSRVSPNGRFLAFMSRRPLTKFDNRDAHTGEPAEEVFLYDASTPGALRCVSCSATGARPAGVFDEGEFPGLLVDRPQLWGKQSLAGSIPGWTRIDKARAHYQSRYLSDEGRLFFNSPVGLVPGDSNAKEDVYEFEPAGVGGCPITQTNGCQALISSGTAPDESAFLDASATGEDVFFLTSSKLVGADRDNALDVYDAHVCTTAVPCPSGTVNVPAACNGTDSCRAAPAAQPTFGAPASATFTGAGNVPPPPPVKPAAKPLTRVQKLARALKACRTKHNKHRRTLCEKQARHTYGPARKAKRANTHRGTRR